MFAIEAPLQAIKKELECSVCLEALKEPKIVGSCYHVFCKDCLRKYISSKQTQGRFLCPDCRKQYDVPANGVDGLRDDFRSANLVAILMKTDANYVSYHRNMCSECYGKGGNRDDASILADYLCDTCDLDLCSGCQHEHSGSPELVDHIVYDLCTTHWRKMKHYCKSCSMVICSVCMVKSHYSADHNIIFYKDSFEDDVTKITDKTRNILAKAMKKHNTAMESEQALINESESRIKTVSNFANSIVKETNSEISQFRSKIKEMETQVMKLERHVEDVTIRTDSFVKTEKAKIERYSQSMQTFKEVLFDLMNELRKYSEQLEKFRSTRCLGSAHRASIVCCKEEIRSLTTNITDTLKSEPRFQGPAPIPNLDAKCPVFTTAKYFQKLDYEGNNVERIFSIEILPINNGVAILGGPSLHRTSTATKILFTTSLKSNDVCIVTDGVSSAVDMTLKNNGDLILLRKHQPLVRIYQHALGGTCKYVFSQSHDLTLPSNVGNPKSISFDEVKNRFIILGVKPGQEPNSKVSVIDGSNGRLLQTIGCSSSGRLCFDPMKQLIYKCYSGVESFQYKESGGHLDIAVSKNWQFPSDIFDINLSDGRLFAVGKSEKKNVMLYHIGQDKLIKWLGTLTSGEGQPVVSDRPCNPRSALRDYLLLVGVGSSVLFFRLV